MEDKDYNFKEYEFDFGNPFKKFLSYALCCFFYLSIIFYLFFGIFALLAYIDDSVRNSLFVKVLFYVLIAMITAFAIFLTVLNFRPKKVVLTNYAIDIQRNSLPSLYHINRGFNDYIMYSDIEYYDFDEQAPSYRFYHLMDLPFIYYNYYSVVKIKDKKGRLYHIPVKKVVDFICDLDEKTEQFEASKTSKNNC